MLNLGLLILVKEKINKNHWWLLKNIELWTMWASLKNKKKKKRRRLLLKISTINKKEEATTNLNILISTVKKERMQIVTIMEEETVAFREMTEVEVNSKKEEVKEVVIRIMAIIRVEIIIIEIKKIRLTTIDRTKKGNKRKITTKSQKWYLNQEDKINHTNKLMITKKEWKIKEEEEVEAEDKEVEEVIITTRIKIMTINMKTVPLNVSQIFFNDLDSDSRSY